MVLVKVFPAFDLCLLLYYYDYDYLVPSFTGRWIWFGYDLYYWKYHCHGFSCWWHELRVFWICWGDSLFLMYDLTYYLFMNDILVFIVVTCEAGFLQEPYGRSHKVFWNASQGMNGNVYDMPFYCFKLSARYFMF